MPSSTTSSETTTESLTIAIDSDIAAYLEQRNVKDINGYLIDLIQQEQARQIGGKHAQPLGTQAEALSQHAPNAV